MKKLIAIGEALIDFAPNETGKSIKNVQSFTPITGGAPANVCGAYSKLGGSSQLITQLGMDPFGDKIIDDISSFGIGCDYIARTKKANTSLAFVSLGANGEREFSFYRNPGADMLLEADAVKKEWFEDAYALHFCSVSLGNFPMKEAHKRAIEYAREKDMIVSFDPNIRLALWENQEELRQVVREFLPLADVIKISDEEIEFITGMKTIEEAKEFLFRGNVKVIIYTKGPDGAEVYTKSQCASVNGTKVNAVDTTGAGDAFIGSFLYQISEQGIQKGQLEDLSSTTLEDFLRFSSFYCAMSVTKAGAIASYATKEEILSQMK